MPNEQVKVPLFAASEILTAANMNISAGTGVPVFTNSTTRDAGFGGAGEKVLAEGQLCYLSDSNIVQYYSGASWATVGPSTGKVVQIVSSQTGAVSTGTTQIPSDDTIPQITEGTQFMSLAITPTSATNILQIVIEAQIAVDGADIQYVCALFQDATANALAAVGGNSRTNRIATPVLVHTMTAGTTSATTFRYRVGPSAAQTITFNGVAAGRYFGGVGASSIIITEYTP
jgi:hypothetical protein